MPSITPSYLYTFVALLAVSSLLLFSFMAYADALLFSSEVKQLKNLMDSLAAKGTELLTLTLTTNATSEANLQMPAVIGNKQYWLQIRNDSEKTWIEGGFGNTPIEETELRVYLPKEAYANGYFIGGYGVAHLKCYFEGVVLQILLESSS
ncbi:hypothetical protein HXY32_03525 [Candidatus Bathyarchaeota archaeon]|nr:hypothetical protein [Candidatus Bathyarchaeota archaeon]